jgi:uncharacterized membrane protein
MTTLARTGPAPVAERVLALTARWPAALLWLGMGGYAFVLSWLSVQRHRGFYTGRLDLGNMLQAAWSTAHGDFLSSTAITGEQISRLGVHVDPILALFAPLVAIWPRPEALLVAQAVIVAVGALPVFWLARRWLGNDVLALAGAALYLLYPALQWATVTEFHPVVLAAPLLAFAIWAAEEGRYRWLALFALLALLTKEEVGLSLVILGVWMALRGRRRAGALLAAASAAWVAFAVAFVIPVAGDGGSPLSGRYASLGDGPGEVLATLVLRPWEVPHALVADGALLMALLLPLLLLPFAAPLLAAAALPEILLNVLSSHGPQHQITHHYAAAPAPFLVTAAILGLARLRVLRRPPWLGRALGAPAPLALLLVAAGWASGVRLGPLPWWQDLPGASRTRAYEYTVTHHAEVLARAVALVPDGVPVSASNHMGAHLSARKRIYLFPVVEDARWVAIDIGRRPLGIEVGPFRHAVGAVAFMTRQDFEPVFAENGVMVFRRRRAA